MPASISKDQSGKGHQVKTPGGVMETKMTLRNTKKQARILNAIDHGWKPDPNYKKKGK
jgi:hypothetical protein